MAQVTLYAFQTTVGTSKSVWVMYSSIHIVARNQGKFTAAHHALPHRRPIAGV
jgi:hypothetical protein